jgi:hypothetical protein
LTADDALFGEYALVGPFSIAGRLLGGINHREQINSGSGTFGRATSGSGVEYDKADVYQPL